MNALGIPPKKYERVLLRVLQHAVRCVFVHPVKLTLTWKPLDLTPESEELWEDFLDGDELERVERWVRSLTWDTPILAGTDLKVHGFGPYVSPDLECADLELPIWDFVWVTFNPRGVSLRDLTEGVYRMKCYKYDYECEELSNVTCDRKGDEAWSVHVEFEYEF